ncbi:MAG: PQQ-like beta-propeller repeat protein [Candidatus Riflebacteria bacterium]|nr:PQQ-like beta-propeller repeat protein [Candidatus Riflebacteria bacterium]
MIKAFLKRLFSTVDQQKSSASPKQVPKMPAKVVEKAPYFTPEAAPSNHFLQFSETLWDTEIPPSFVTKAFVCDETLVIATTRGAEGILLGLDAQTGSIHWEQTGLSRENYKVPSAFQAGDHTVVQLWNAESTDSSSTLLWLDSKTGKEVSRVPLETDDPVEIARYGSQTLIVGTRHIWNIPEGTTRFDRLCALQTQIKRPVVIHNDMLYGMGENAKIFGLDLKTGQCKWETNAPIHPEKMLGHDEALLLYGNKDNLYRVGITTKGVRYWLDLNSSRREERRTPAVCDHYLAWGVGLDFDIYEPYTGKKQVSYSSFCNPTIADGFLYYVWDNRLICRHLDSGKEFQSKEIDGMAIFKTRIIGSPIIEPHRAYIICNGHVMAIGVANQ